MSIKKSHLLFGLNLFLLLAVMAGSLQALEEPDRSGLGQAEFKVEELTIENEYREPRQLPAQAYANAQADLAALGSGAKGHVDVRGGRWASLLLSEPLLPGKGNGLQWANLGRGAPKNATEHANAASQAFRGYLENNNHPLRIDLDELADPGNVAVHEDGAVIQIYMPRVFEGVPVRGSHLTATINHGNLVLFGTDNWGDIKSSTAPGISKKTADNAIQAYVGPYPVVGEWGKSELVLIPVAVGQNPKQVAVGKGFDYRLAWVIRPAFDGDQRRFEALVDAQTGRLLSFEDTNDYAEAKGGVYPVTNDGIVPDGVEQTGWPMPWMYVGSATTDTGGNYNLTGSQTATFNGPYVNMADNCGTDSLTQSAGINWGSSGGTDCVTPGFGGAGNTHASRSGFYELNRIKEMARSHLPANTWLQGRLTANMNINNTCNAFWNGTTVNFYRSGGGCANTGEIAAVFDHEWGHGMDANDVNGGIASPSGEGIADIYSSLRLYDSCIGRNFQSTNCSGNGDPCLECTGVRDIDYEKRASGQPHDYTWSNAHCGGSVHCVGGVYSEAVWSLWKRQLRDLYGYDNNTAAEIVTRLTYIAAGVTSTWFSGGPPNGGCGGSSGYMNYLAADDDNGNLNDGTPHMQAIFNAFNDQEIACQTPAVPVTNTSCPGTPTSAPNVTATAFDKSVSLSWGPVGGATKYEVFRTEGVFDCDFGKVKLGSTTNTTWNDAGLQNGRDYSYVVIPKGSNNACFGPASSCTPAAPAAGPSLAIDTSSASSSVSGGDLDAYLDNCEDGMMTFDVKNTGLGTLNNVHIVSVTPSNVGVTVIPAAISPSTLAQNATGTGSFSFTAGGLTPGETLGFQVAVTADELSGSNIVVDLTVTSTETDLTFTPSVLYSFETDTEGWTTVQGTFGRSSTGGGSNGSWYEQSSANLDNQCDQVMSPTVVFSATTTLSLSTDYKIEPIYTPTKTWYDRANVGLVVNGGSRSLITPDSGRTYNASGAQGTCGTSGQGGWADAATWGSSSFSAGALGSAALDGAEVQLDIRYGTDSSVNGDGFRFDQVALTNVSFLGADGQSDSCGVTTTTTTTTAAPTTTTTTTTTTVPTTTTTVPTTTTTVPTTTTTTTSTTTTTIIVNPTVHVASVVTGTLNVGGGSKRGTATVTLAHSDGSPFSSTSYTVQGVFGGSFGEQAKGGTTDSNGIVGFVTTGNTLRGGVSVTFCISAVIPGSWDYNPNDNGTGVVICSSTPSSTTTTTTSTTSTTAAPTTTTTSTTTTTLPSAVIVANVVTGLANAGGGNKRGTATVTLVNADSLPVSGYFVQGDFGGSFILPENKKVISTAGTNGSGVITLETTNALRGGVSVTFCVSGVSTAADGPFSQPGALNGADLCPLP